jgi:hypothetical protein
MLRKIALGSVGFFLLVLPLVVLAQTAGGFNSTPTASGGNTLVTSANKVQNPLGVNTVCGLIKGVLSAATQIGIPVAVLFLVWAGFKFVLARGSSDKINEAKENLFHVVIGIGIFLGAWLLTQFIANTVNNLQQGSSNPININACN